MRTPDQSNAAADTPFVQYGTGHPSARNCDDRLHVGGPVLMQRGGKAIKCGPLTLGWRCSACVARRAASRVGVVA